MRSVFAVSTRVWRDRIILIAILVAVVVLVAFSASLSFPFLLAFWGLWLLGIAVLVRRGWGRVIGPVFFYDLLCTARRGRYFLLRFLFGLSLLVLLWWVYIAWQVGSGSRTALDARQLSRFVESFFYAFMGMQLLAVTVLTPAYTAGAIAEEKERRTLEFLLATDLEDREIVLGKVLARLANIALLLLVGLPVISLLQVIGGIDPNLVLSAYAVTGLMAASIAGIGVLNSVLSRRGRDAILATYAWIVAYYFTCALSPLLLTPQLGVADWHIPGIPFTVASAVEVFNYGNLFGAMRRVGMAVAGGAPLVDVLPSELLRFAAFQGTVALITLSLAVIRLRPVALREVIAKAPTNLEKSLRIRRRPAVGKWPMVWKEVYAEPGPRRKIGTWVVLTLGLGVCFFPVGMIFYSMLSENKSLASSQDDLYTWMSVVSAAIASVMLLGIAVRAAGAISTERDRQTMDGLLTTPLSAQEMLAGKLVGSVLGLRAGLIWLGLCYALGLVTGVLHPVSLVLLLMAWLVYAATLASIGIWFSLACATSLRATVFTLVAAGFLGGGHFFLWMCCAPCMFLGGGARGSETFVKIQASMTPPAALGRLLVFSPVHAGYGWGHKEDWEIFGGLAGLVGWTLLGGSIYLAALQRFRKDYLRAEQATQAVSAPPAPPVAGPDGSA